MHRNDDRSTCFLDWDFIYYVESWSHRHDALSYFCIGYDHAACLQGLLTVEAMTAVKMLLPEYANGDLAAVCSWADDIRHSFGWHWTSCLHYVDTPDFKCNYNYCRIIFKFLFMIP